MSQTACAQHGLEFQCDLRGGRLVSKLAPTPRTFCPEGSRQSAAEEYARLSQEGGAAPDYVQGDATPPEQFPLFLHFMMFFFENSLWGDYGVFPRRCGEMPTADSPGMILLFLLHYGGSRIGGLVLHARLGIPYAGMVQRLRAMAKLASGPGDHTLGHCLLAVFLLRCRA